MPVTPQALAAICVFAVSARLPQPAELLRRHHHKPGLSSENAYSSTTSNLEDSSLIKACEGASTQPLGIYSSSNYFLSSPGNDRESVKVGMDVR